MSISDRDISSEPTDDTLAGVAERELVEETGIDPGTVSCVSQAPVYVEYGRVWARPEKDEPDHFHLDFG
jgi:8-oxo-dGTP pyrophosphatase MutT (NUDIX family)